MNSYFDLNAIYRTITNFIKQEAFGITLVTVIIIIVSRLFSNAAARYVQSEEKKREIRKWARYITICFVILWILILYNSHVQKDSPFYLFIIGIFLAFIAIGLKDLSANFEGWMIIISNKGFKNGDRIKVGTAKGDVIDIGILRTIIAEIGEWAGGDQSTGRLISMPNSTVLSNEIYNYTQGYEYIWDELRVLITFESNWKKAESILNEIALEDFNQKKEQIEENLKAVQSRYLLRYNYITPKVYVNIKDSGVELSIRYLVRVRRRRTLQDIIIRDILNRFGNEPDIDLAYPTIRRV